MCVSLSWDVNKEEKNLKIYLIVFDVWAKNKLPPCNIRKMLVSIGTGYLGAKCNMTNDFQVSHIYLKENTEI